MPELGLKKTLLSRPGSIRGFRARGGGGGLGTSSPSPFNDCKGGDGVPGDIRDLTRFPGWKWSRGALAHYQSQEGCYFLEGRMLRGDEGFQRWIFLCCAHTYMISLLEMPGGLCMA